MKKNSIAVIQHHQAEGAGRIAIWANINHQQLQYFFAPDEELPNLDDFDGLIILGGPMDVVDNPMWMQQERELIVEAVNKNLPLLAICLGSQLLASVLGAKLYPLSTPELGWKNIKFYFTDEDNDSSYELLKGQTLSVPQWHYQGFLFELTECPSKAMRIAKKTSIQLSPIHIEAQSSLCKQQIFRHQRQLGLQFHPEWDEAQLQQLQLFFKEDCPFIAISQPLVQQRIEQWFFSELNHLFQDSV